MKQQNGQLQTSKQIENWIGETKFIIHFHLKFAKNQ